MTSIRSYVLPLSALLFAIGCPELDEGAFDPLAPPEEPEAPANVGEAMEGEETPSAEALPGDAASDPVLMPPADRAADEKLAEAVRSALAADKTLAGFTFDVDVVNGVVTLDGTIDNVGLKMHATDIVSELDGVDRVQNDMRVAPKGTKPVE